MESNMSATLSGHPSSSTSNSYLLNGKIMLCSVVTLFVVIAILVGIHSYIRCLVNRRSRLRLRRPSHRLFFLSSSNTTTSASSTSSNKALDLSILKTIPTFVYSSSISSRDQLLECAVCLSEFEDNEKGRVLPKCNHAFHVECIDMWFYSHSNCPLCRAPVEEGVSVTDQPAACSSGQREEAEQEGCSSGSLPPLELVGVLVEVPRGSSRGSDDMGLGSPEGSGFKSPGNRVLTLKRIWSV